MAGANDKNIQKQRTMMPDRLQKSSKIEVKRCPKLQKLQMFNSENGAQMLEAGIWNLEMGIRSLEAGSRSLETEYWSLEVRNRNLEAGS